MRQEETKECEEVGCQGEEREDSDSPGALAQQFYEWPFSGLLSFSISLFHVAKVQTSVPQ